MGSSFLNFSANFASGISEFIQASLYKIQGLWRKKNSYSFQGLLAYEIIDSQFQLRKVYTQNNEN